MRSIDGKLLKKMLISATNNLYNNYPEVDALNVFPVPDGDTGMNMNLTMSSGAKEIQNRNDDDVGAIMSTFSRGLLMGARGNSGVITSQIFRGISQSLKQKKIIKIDDFIEAFMNGSKVAYKAVMRPVEGTILTVARESAQYLSDHANSSMSIEQAMTMLLKEAQASLKRTPELLPILKEVGVVDSGGAGLCKIYEGMKSALDGVFIEKATATSVAKQQLASATDLAGYELKFTLILGPEDSKKVFVEKRYTSVLESHGEVKSVSLDDGVVEVELKTLTPGQIISYSQSFGEFATLSIVNLDLEKPSDEPKVEEKVAQKIEPVSENKGPLKEYAIVSISAGEGVDELFKELGVDEIVSGGQTMNPATEDIVAAIKKAHAKTVYVFPNNGNIIMAASQASDVLRKECEVMVVPTKTILEGISGISAFNPDATVAENYEEMKSVAKNVKSGQITYAIKDASIDGLEVKKDYFMGFIGKHINVCEQDKFVTFYKLIEQMIDEESSIVTVLLGEDIAIEEVENIQTILSKKYPDAEIDVRYGKQPVYSFLIGVE